MEADALTTIAGMLDKGGSVVTIVAVIVAYKAGQTARDAVKALTEIRDAVIATKPIVQRIDDRGQALENMVTAILNRQLGLLPGAPLGHHG